MFEEFIRSHKAEDPEQPDKDRIEADKTAVFARINAESAADFSDIDSRIAEKNADGDSSDDIEVLIPQEVHIEEKNRPLRFIIPLVSAAAAVAVAVVAGVNLFGKQPVAVDINSSSALSATSADVSDSAASSAEQSSADSASSEVNSSDDTSSDDNSSGAGPSDICLPTAWDAAVFSARYIRTHGYVEGEKYPKTLWITSKEELTDYYEQNKDKYDLGTSQESRFTFSDIISDYDEEFFKTNNLIFVFLEESSGSIGHAVTNVIYRTDDKSLGITIKRLLPEVGTADMAKWNIVMEVDKEMYAETVTVDFNDASSADIPELEAVAQLSSDEAAELLKSFTFGDLCYKWGEPAWALSGFFSEGWEYDGGKTIVCCFGQEEPDLTLTVQDVRFLPEHV